MTPADKAFVAGYAAALDAAESAGIRILQSRFGHPVRREHAAGGLLNFVDAAREALTSTNSNLSWITTTVMPAQGISVTRTSSANDAHVHHSDTGHAATASPSSNTAHAPLLPAASRAAAVGMGYTGDSCTICASFSVKRNGSCLVCESYGSTTGCS